NSFGGVVGTNSRTITACYWVERTDVTGSTTNGGGGTLFSDSAWPSTTGSSGQSTEWGTGDGSGSGTYWKSLGGWNGGGTYTVYPTLWFEE
ncbi:hypothetical protein, partial [Treponema primitia]|uniref:hypothetical protein n=1 Tax=Treponema primitia TaxID=88058 RepID=UPI0002554E66